MSKCLIYMTGDNGEIELYEDRLIIKREGIFAKLSHGFFKGDKTIYLNQISGIQIKKASTFLVGYIQFTLSGGIERTKGITDAVNDENTVTFTKKNNDVVYDIQRKIEELKSKNAMSNIINQLSPADEIKKYKTLLDENVISKEEFEAKKKQLLDL